MTCVHWERRPVTALLLAAVAAAAGEDDAREVCIVENYLASMNNQNDVDAREFTRRWLLTHTGDASLTEAVLALIDVTIQTEAPIGSAIWCVVHSYMSAIAGEHVTAFANAVFTVSITTQLN